MITLSRKRVYLDETIGSRAEPQGNLMFRGWIQEEQQAEIGKTFER